MIGSHVMAEKSEDSSVYGPRLYVIHHFNGFGQYKTTAGSLAWS